MSLAGTVFGAIVGLIISLVANYLDHRGKQNPTCSGNMWTCTWARVLMVVCSVISACVCGAVVGSASAS